MAAARFLMIVRDPSLKGQVSSILVKKNRCSVECVSSIQAAFDRVRAGGISLVLVDVPKSGDITEVANFVSELASCERPIPAIVAPPVTPVPHHETVAMTAILQ